MSLWGTSRFPRTPPQWSLRPLAGLDREDRRQVARGLDPLVALVGRDEDRAALRAQVDPGRVEAVEAHALAHDRGPGLLRQAAAEELPRVAPVARAVETEPAVGGDAVLGPDLGDHVGRVRVVRIERERKAEPGRQAVAVQPLPGVATIVGAVDAAVVLLPEPLG